MLAAGAATRFGSDKLAAILEGRSVLEHVIDALLAVPLHEVTVVTRRGRDVPATDAAVRWVENPAPEGGLSSSLRVGLAAILEGPGPTVEAVLVALGDQPRIEPAVIRELLRAAAIATEPVVVPRYVGDAARNPVLLRREAFGLIGEASGDRGLGPVLDAHRELVHELVVTGTNPDVDTPADLARLERETGSGPRAR